MLKAKVWNKSVPRVELDQRVRDARLRLERIEWLLMPRATATTLWFRRVVCLFSFGTSEGVSRVIRIQGPLGNQPPRMPQFPRSRIPVAG
jgi:hypothetical protein